MLSYSLRIATNKVSSVFTGSKFLRTSTPIYRRDYSTVEYSTAAAAKPAPQKEANAEKITTIDPLDHPDFFGVHKLFTVKDLFDARVHYGHKIGTLDDRMRPFIFGSRLGHLIFDLDQTADFLRAALNFTAHIAFRDGIILFVSRNPLATHLVEKTAKECQEFAHTRFWKPGTFTDATKEFKAVTRLPDLCIFITTLNDVLTQQHGITECAKMLIPSVAIVDTNCNPNLVTYPVPGNDDSLASIELYCSLFKEAILRGKKARNKIMDAS
ncbi:28S ribosomal protein S2, mitochondrial isoform X2 [Chelonus insularis]|uniref:28S ribosomal protein S2, mitochondrial isoform X2 n=1 Tax=Chelonus insularis TaxID=460826 RepID=UPI0015896BD9|nr:28S ribosomal protein S2, mitochondrial isoform X2 [Chelonus insularis]